MKKSIRTLMSLALAIMLVASMAIPAFAVSGTCNGYSYTWSVTSNATSATASIRTTTTPTNVSAYVENAVYNALNNVTRPVKSGDQRTTGYSYASAIAGNVFWVNGVKLDGEIRETTADFWVGSTQVAMGVHPD